MDLSTIFRGERKVLVERPKKWRAEEEEED
jgi:hypothetical protein